MANVNENFIFIDKLNFIHLETVGLEMSILNGRGVTSEIFSEGTIYASVVRNLQSNNHIT